MTEKPAVKGRNGTEGSIIVHFEFVLSFSAFRRGFESPTAHGFITKFIVNKVGTLSPYLSDDMAMIDDNGY